MKNLYLITAVLFVISNYLLSAREVISNNEPQPNQSVRPDTFLSSIAVVYTNIAFGQRDSIENPVYQVMDKKRTPYLKNENLNSNKTLNITCLLQGLYHSGGMMRKAQDASGDQWPGTIADQINIELRATDWSLAYTLANITLNTNGTAVGSVPAVFNGNYYINIRHRNSIETCSSIPVSFSVGIVNYNFTTDGSQAYGSNMIFMPDGYWAFYGGDENQDGLVDATDMIDVDNDASTFASGYLATDLNGDGLVDSGDMIIVDNNTNNFVSVINPTTATIATITTSGITGIYTTSATGGGNAISDGGVFVSARGVCWSTSSNPTLADSHTIDGSGTGAFTSNITGLTPNTPYFVRAYATNSIGTAYGNEESFTTMPESWTCGSSLTIYHVAGLVAPVGKTVTYNTVTNIPGEPSKCWITSNLGADYQASSFDDFTEASAGWYWQFNRKQGYKHDGTTRTPNIPWNYIDEDIFWESANDPCLIELGSGWRLPTLSEWYNVDNIGGWTIWNDPWNSGLKMHAAGNLDFSTGSLYARGAYGFYWSSTQYSTAGGKGLFFSSYQCQMEGYIKSYGNTLRCIKD